MVVDRLHVHKYRADKAPRNKQRRGREKGMMIDRRVKRFQTKKIAEGDIPRPGGGVERGHQYRESLRESAKRRGSRKPDSQQLLYAEKILPEAWHSPGGGKKPDAERTSPCYDQACSSEARTMRKVIGHSANHSKPPTPNRYQPHSA